MLSLLTVASLPPWPQWEAVAGLPVMSWAKGRQWGGLYSGYSLLQKLGSYAVSDAQTELLIVGTAYRGAGLFILVRDTSYFWVMGFHGRQRGIGVDLFKAG